jgi:hypothetical protein
MLAIVTFDGFVFASKYFDNPFGAIEWLVTQRAIRGDALTYAIESFEGFILHTL